MKLCLRLFTPAVILAVFLLDRASKLWILRHVALGDSIPLLPFFHITHIENTGVAFGMGQNRNRLFIGVTIALLAFLLYLRRHWEKSGENGWLLRAGIALVIGGALGNLYDRIAYGSVVDFLLFFYRRYQWPAFNVADSAVCVGAFLLFISQWKGREPAEIP